jgi:hypothetical protein
MNTELAQEAENRVIVSLTITTDRDPSEVSDLVGLQPSKTWRAGDLIGSTARRYQQGGWQLSSPSFADVEPAVDQLLSAIAVRTDELRGIAREAQLQIGIVVYANAFVPAILLRADQVKTIADLGASIDVDLYCLMNS